MLRRFLAAATLAIALATSCVSPEVDDDTVPEFSTDTVMGLIQERGTLRVAMDPDLGFPWASAICPAEAELKTHRYDVCLGRQPEGFLVDFAHEVATSLGVEAEFSSAPAEALFTSMEPEASTYDLAFPALPVTESLVREHTFANPYYVAHQRLLVPATSGLDSPYALGSQTVCEYIDATTGVPVSELAPTADVFSPSKPSCDAALLKRGVQSATAPDLFLIQWHYRLQTCADRKCRTADPPDMQIVGDQLTTEGFAPMVEEAATGMADWVSAVLGEAKNEGRYMEWYDAWIAPYLEDPITEPPTMTIEEAAALFPIDPG